jgi:hypothetical protein
MTETRRLAELTVPWGRQEIQLDEVHFGAGGLPLLRVRIREAKRFTIFDIDAGTASRWAEAMAAWAATQPCQPPVEPADCLGAGAVVGAATVEGCR